MRGACRRRGRHRAMRWHDLRTRARRVQSADDVHAARTAAKPLVDTGGTVAAGGTLALGCYYALRERGISPGWDVALVGFDDSPTARILSPGPTSVAQPLEAVGLGLVGVRLSWMPPVMRSSPDSTPADFLAACTPAKADTTSTSCYTQHSTQSASPSIRSATRPVRKPRPDPPHTASSPQSSRLGSSPSPSPTAC
ncbi:substrate-binding domain-containing protein [Streptomyces sp. NBC_00199]|uniref:substrate-binding domain-containing protein n=1 Tax=Streptomyces sp. NBC_00199 TaxID=2975678 RepID=UPI0022518791|nr:substrate-binding domain-containing protein [Streptomyces sp. NBC_00199]MCX5264994.1 substrate-binding domain-containing protein [Streptomyces sp. NBC_00199]